MITRRTLIHTTVLTAVATPAAAATAAPAKPPAAAPLTNLAHLRFLLDEVPLPDVDGHSTSAGGSSGLAPWTYVDRSEDDTFARVGGGTLDESTGHWSQGAYNADDISRCAIVFLRAHAVLGEAEDLETARQLLRTLAYLQDDSGAHAGNVVLWMQPDGTLNPSAIPVELPDPSDSDESYWLARTVWALGEGVAAFHTADKAFAGFLEERLHLALDALERASLGRYGQWESADGVRVPGWLIAGGADATGEAVLGLAAHLTARPGDARAATALQRYSEAIAAMASGDVGTWPFGAIMPWTGSQSLWHAWGGLAPAALAAASQRTDAALPAAVGDAGVFTPQLLTSGGPYNAWSPVPGEAQIAYGVHGRVESLLRVAEATGGQGLRELAAHTAGWFFGANPAGQPAYDPATGVTVDGIEPDGRVNRNSGAESTIHALLTMLLLDAHPDLARTAKRLTTTAQTHGMLWLPAEEAELGGGAAVVTPDSAWTGESNWHGAYVLAEAGDTVRFTLTGAARDAVSAGGATAHPVLHRAADEAGTATWIALDADGAATVLGSLALGGIGDPGLTEWDGVLKPIPLETEIPAGTTAIQVEVDGRLELDELMLLPAVTTARFPMSGRGAETVAVATSAARIAVEPGETGSAYAADGTRRGPMNHGRRTLQAGEFAVVRG